MSKNAWYIIVVCALALLALIAWHFFKPSSYINYPPQQGPVVAVGDSLVQGVGATEGNDFVSLVSQSINEPVQNFGVSGDTTEETRARLDEVLAENPRIVLVLVGGNDYLKRVPKTETFANLRAIVERLQQEGALVVLLGVRGGVLVDNFADDFEDLAKETGSVYVSDVLNNMLGNKQYMYDQIHPNDEGYAIIAERVVKVLRPVLR